MTFNSSSTWPTAEEINEAANEALFSGELARALVLSSLAVDVNHSDWAIVRYACCADKLAGPEQALLILHKYNSNIRDTNYRLARIHFLLRSGKVEDASVAAAREIEEPCKGRINFEYLLSLAKVLISQKNSDGIKAFARKYGPELLSELWLLNAFVSQLRFTSNSDDVLLILLHQAEKNWSSLGEAVKQRIAFFMIVLGFDASCLTSNLNEEEWSSLNEFKSFFEQNPLLRALDEYDDVAGSSRFVSDFQLAEMVRGAIASSAGFSFLRMGDGEGRFVTDLSSMPSVAKEALEVAKRVWFWNSPGAPPAGFIETLRDAYVDADVVGLNPPGRIQYEARNSYLGYIGVVAGNRFVIENVQAREHFVTENWNNEVLDRRSFFQEIAILVQSRCKEVVVISPYRDLKKSIDFLNKEWVDIIVIPSEGNKYLRPRSIVVPHYPDSFETVLAKIRTKRGSVFLVAGGAFGKIYCAEAKRFGNVAIDIGSIIDRWMNVPTR